MLVRIIAAISLIALPGCASLADLPGIRSVLTPDVAVDASALRDGDYTLDPAHAGLYFSLDHMQLSTLTGQFRTMRASLSFDQARPEAARLDVIIDLDSLQIATEDFTEQLKGADWFNTHARPQARFVSTGITVTGDNTGRVSGDLSLNGTTAPVTLDVTFNGGADVPISGAYTLGFDATGTLNRSDFGLGQFSSFVSDKVSLRFSGEFQRTQE